MDISQQRFEHLNEGLGAFFRRIGEWFTGGMPKIAGVVNIMDEYDEDVDRCDRSFPPLRDTNVKVHLPKMSDKYDHPQTITYKDYEEDPRHALCLLQAQIDYAKNLLKFLQTHTPDVVCQHNENKDRCKKWIVRNISYLQSELRSATKDLEMLKKNPPTNNRQTSFVAFKRLTETIDRYLDFLDEQ